MKPESYVTDEAIVLAIEKVEQIVIATGNEQDLAYFNFHKNRFLRMARSIAKICKTGQVLLDIGSHYLHSSLILTFLGYKVHSMDVTEFWSIDFVKERAEKYDLVPVIEDNLESLGSCLHKSDEYDLILFTEILEHITFNPINFWKQLHRILKNKGVIYITTPNSLTFFSITRTLLHLIQLKGIGQDIDSIFRNVTYGHHWKEYSSAEIRKYFRKMNDGFSVEISKYSYKQFPIKNLKDRLRAIFLEFGNLVPYFRGEIEAVIRVNKSGEWLIHPPEY